MRIPQKPPDFVSLMRRITADQERLHRVVTTTASRADDRYLHWDELRHREAPHGITHEEWWVAEKLSRITSAQLIPLRDASQSAISLQRACDCS